MEKTNQSIAKVKQELTTVQDGMAVMTNNATMSTNCLNSGRALEQRVHKEGAMNELLAGEVDRYVEQCRTTLAQMNSVRMPLTRRLTEIQKQFVAFENDIDPAKSGTPANNLLIWKNQWLIDQKNQAVDTEKRLEKNYQQTERRVASREDWDAAQKAAAMERAKERLLTGRTELRMKQIETVPVPVVLEPRGYIDLFKFWWEEIGKGLPDSDLERVFRPMMSYARKQAKKGRFCESVYIEYREVPKAA